MIPSVSDFSVQPLNPFDSPHTAVGFTVHAFRSFAAAPDDASRATLRSVLKMAREAVSPPEAFPGWLSHVSLACAFVLLAEGQLEAASRVLSEFETLDAELGCNLLLSPKIRTEFEALRVQTAAMIQGVDTLTK